LFHVKMKSRLISYKLVFFADRPCPKDFLKLAQYSYCATRSGLFGFKRENCFTKFIDLLPNNEEILAKFRASTRRDIKKSIGMGIIVNVEENLERFVKFYNLFANSKKRPPIALQYLKSLGENLIILKASDDRDDLVMLSFLIDPDAKRVRVLAGGTLFRYETDADKIKHISMAHRFLHFAAMLFFKGLGCHIYDLGGYDYEHKDAECVAINIFKDSFRGELLEESIYISYPLFAYQVLGDQVYKLINKLRAL
jgi:lipid II:glycine glycyltransferase (peptidoglycan interpeptide bridge formation enzyme)